MMKIQICFARDVDLFAGQHLGDEFLKVKRYIHILRKFVSNDRRLILIYSYQTVQPATHGAHADRRW